MNITFSKVVKLSTAVGFGFYTGVRLEKVVSRIIDISCENVVKRIENNANSGKYPESYVKYLKSLGYKVDTNKDNNVKNSRKIGFEY